MLDRIGRGNWGKASLDPSSNRLSELTLSEFIKTDLIYRKSSPKAQFEKSTAITPDQQADSLKP